MSSEILNIIKNSFKTYDFLVPSTGEFVKGSLLNIKQFNRLIDIDTDNTSDFIKFIKYSIATDEIINENIDKPEKLSYFDKPFILIQLKLAQQKDFLGVTLKNYQDTILERLKTVNLSDLKYVFEHQNLKLSFGIKAFREVYIRNIEFYANLTDELDSNTEIITLELFKTLNEVNFQNQPITSENNFSDLKSLLQNMPSNLVVGFNNFAQSVNKTTDTLNSFTSKTNDNFIFTSNIEFMLL
jgi:hypothetical protein